MLFLLDRIYRIFVVLSDRIYRIYMIIRMIGEADKKPVDPVNPV